MFVKDYHKAAAFHTILYYRNSRDIFDERRLFHLEPEREKVPTLALFVDKNIQEMNNIFHSIVSLFISTSLFLLSTPEGKIKSEEKAEMPEKRLLLKFE